MDYRSLSFRIWMKISQNEICFQCPKSDDRFLKRCIVFCLVESVTLGEIPHYSRNTQLLLSIECSLMWENAEAFITERIECLSANIHNWRAVYTKDCCNSHSFIFHFQFEWKSQCCSNITKLNTDFLHENNFTRISIICHFSGMIAVFEADGGKSDGNVWNGWGIWN